MLNDKNLELAKEEELEKTEELKKAEESKKEWKKPSYEEFKFSGCELNGPTAS